MGRRYPTSLRSERRRRAFWIAITLSVLLIGCATAQKSTTLTVNPTGAPITVVSTARAQCWDIIGPLGLMWCNLKIEMESSDGQKVSDFPQLLPLPTPTLAYREIFPKP